MMDCCSTELQAAYSCTSFMRSCQYFGRRRVCETAMIQIIPPMYPNTSLYGYPDTSCVRVPCSLAYPLDGSRRIRVMYSLTLLAKSLPTPACF